MKPAITPHLNIIGGGKLGRTLGRLWTAQNCLQVAQVFCERLNSAQQAVDFIGAGQATHRWEAFESAEFWLIATPDGAIANSALTLARSGLIRDGDIVFHCSGALPSTFLHPLTDSGALTASIHPVHSFADPAASVQTFAGTLCACEGNPQALEHLMPLFDTLGAQLLTIDSDCKSLYHTGAVIACNYLAPLLDASLQCLQTAGLARRDAAALLAPLVHSTTDNVLQTSATQALTGPIARGDQGTIEKQLQALAEQLPHLLPLYKTLGLVALTLAEQQQSVVPSKEKTNSGGERHARLQQIKALLKH